MRKIERAVMTGNTLLQSHGKIEPRSRPIELPSETLKKLIKRHIREGPIFSPTSKPACLTIGKILFNGVASIDIEDPACNQETAIEVLTVVSATRGHNV